MLYKVKAIHGKQNAFQFMMACHQIIANQFRIASKLTRFWEQIEICVMSYRLYSLRCYILLGKAMEYKMLSHFSYKLLVI